MIEVSSSRMSSQTSAFAGSQRARRIEACIDDRFEVIAWVYTKIKTKSPKKS